MKIEDILSEWSADADLLKDPSQINRSVLSIPKLHHKYYTVFLHEKMVLMKYMAEFNILKKEKKEFYIQGPSKETQKLGWELPAIGRVHKPDVDIYMDADRQIIDSTLKVGLQKEKVDFIKEILINIKYQGTNLKTALEDLKFKDGNA